MPYYIRCSMFLDFDAVELEQFGCVLAPMQFSLQGPGLHFLRGRNDSGRTLGANGAGKSTIWDGLCWVLFGCTPDGRRNPDVRPWYGKGTTKGVVRLRVDDKKYTVARTISPNSLTVNGKTCGQERVDQLLGLPFEVFIHTILFAQGQPLFFDKKPREKMDLFSQVLNLNKWDQRSKFARDESDKLISDIEGLQITKSNLEAEEGRIKTTMHELQRQSDAWEKERSKKQKGVGKEIATLETQLEIVQKRHDEADLALDGAVTELRPLQKRIRSLQNDLRHVEQFHNGLVIAAQSKLRDRKKELAAIDSGDKCPTCGQSIKGTNLEKHKRELRKEIAKFQDGLAHDESQAEIDKVQKSLDTMLKAEEQFRKKVDKAQDELNQLSPQVAELKAKISGLKRAKKEHEDQSNPFQAQWRIMNHTLQQVVSNWREADKELVKTRKALSCTSFWVKGFKEVRLYIIEEILQELELITNSMLPEMGLVDWEVHYAVEKETKSGNVRSEMNVEILSPDNKAPVRWECWSGGEGQRLRIVGALALAEVLLNHAGIDPNLEVLDEPTQHLSDEGVQDLPEYLADRAHRLRKEIWLVDHKVIESSRFDTTSLVIKGREGARIRQ